MMTICPVCGTETASKYQATPYFVCPSCDVWFQWPQLEKLYHGIHEGIPGVMSEGDRQINRNIAAWLFNDVMGSKPGPIIDIGASLPVLASALADLGCESYAVEGDPVPNDFGKVQQIIADFEELDLTDERFDLVIMVHSFEHTGDPLKMMRKLRNWVPTGHVFLRLPQHDVAGFERDLSPGHYAVHPFYHCLSSILAILKALDPSFAVTTYSPMAGSGQADFILTPLS